MAPIPKSSMMSTSIVSTLRRIHFSPDIYGDNPPIQHYLNFQKQVSLLPSETLYRAITLNSKQIEQQKNSASTSDGWHPFHLRILYHYIVSSISNTARAYFESLLTCRQRCSHFTFLKNNSLLVTTCTIQITPSCSLHFSQPPHFARSVCNYTSTACSGLSSYQASQS